MEVMTGLLVQMDANDADLGTVFCKLSRITVGNNLLTPYAAVVFFVKQGAGTIFTAVFV
jgi:hypothetical protein